MSSKSQLVYKDLANAVDFLSDVISQPYNVYIRTAALHSFEICFELAWKYLKAALSEIGLQANSPRQSFCESGKAQLINDVENWLEFIELRDLILHTYKSELADEVYSIITSSFLPACKNLLETAVI